MYYLKGIMCFLLLFSVGSRLCVLGPTRAQWAVIDLSAHLSGMVPVGLYQRQTERQYKALIEHWYGQNNKCILKKAYFLLIINW